jgi:anti-anti-sigma factor
MSELARVEARPLGDALLVRVSGEIDLSNARDVLDGVAAAVPSDASLVVLDLSDTTYLDSSGIAVLFRLAERLGYRRQNLRLVVPAGSSIRTVLELTNVSHAVPIDEELPGAHGGS